MKGKRLRYFVRPSTGQKICFLTKQYYVFPDGRIWNHEKRRFVKQKERKGYMVVHLMDDTGKMHSSIGVHTLVATCFIRLFEKGVNVHHVNHDRRDNRIENLKIISASEHSSQHSLENWANGTFDGVASKASERMKNAWANGKYDGVASQASERSKNAWASGAHKGHGEKVSAKLSKQVAQLTLDGRLVRVWPSTMECDRNGCNQSHVGACCRGERKSHKGYVWQWYEDYLAQQPTAQQRWEARQLHLAF